jgi:hypothetical protein
LVAYLEDNRKRNQVGGMKKSTKNKAMAAGAAAVGLAAAAAAGIAVARRAGAEVTYHVRPREDGWAVVTEGSETPLATHATKREAVTAARQLAGRNAPSQLVIHRTDATIQARHRYRVDD